MRGFILLVLLTTLAACGSSGSNSGTGNTSAAPPAQKLSGSQLKAVHLGDVYPHPDMIFNNFYKETETLQDNGETVNVVNHSVRHHEFTEKKVGCEKCYIYVPVKLSDNIGDGYMLYAEDRNLHWAFWAGGEPPTVSGLPSGQHTYNGLLMFADSNISRSIITSGAVTLRANFNSSTGDIEGTTEYKNNPVYNLRGNITIDNSDGTISSKVLSITDMTANGGQQAQSPVNAFLKGSFHGTEAQNVTGVVSPNYLSWEPFIIFGGAFVASRTPRTE